MSSKSQDASVFSYPGATARKILENFKSDKRRADIDQENVQKIFLLCGTNDVDTILKSPRHMRDKLINTPCQICMEELTDTFNSIEQLVQFLHQWAPNATVRILRILPRESRARNEVITKINCFTSEMISRFDFIKESETITDRFLFATRSGFRKSDYFSNHGSDNVHLNEKGVIRFAKYLKFFAHNC